MRNWILNADDYGLTAGVSRGIRQAFNCGVLSSTTAMMNLPDAAAEVSAAQEESPDLPIGIHLCLTAGEPLSPPGKIPGLVDAHGRFRPQEEFFFRLDEIRTGEVEREWRKQIESLLALGARPDHLDSHHHVSYSSPQLFKLFLTLAREYQTAVRPPFRWTIPPAEVFADVPSGNLAAADPECAQLFASSGILSADILYLDFYDRTATLENLLRIVETFPEGTGEIMCHPGISDEFLAARSDYAAERTRELDIICHPVLPERLSSGGIRRTSYAQLAAG